MREVRRDVRDKLLTGLMQRQEEAKKTGASIPRRYKYHTGRAKHYIYQDVDEHIVYFNSELYNGTKCHSSAYCNTLAD